MEDARGEGYESCVTNMGSGVIKGFCVFLSFIQGFVWGCFLVLCVSVNTSGLPLSQCVSLREQMQLCVCVCGKLQNVNAPCSGSEPRASCSRPRAHSTPPSRVYHPHTRHHESTPTNTSPHLGPAPAPRSSPLTRLGGRLPETEIPGGLPPASSPDLQPNVHAPAGGRDGGWRRKWGEGSGTLFGDSFGGFLGAALRGETPFVVQVMGSRE